MHSCTSTLRKKAFFDAVIADEAQCADRDMLYVGSTGVPVDCKRIYNVQLFHFLLPDVPPDLIRAATLSFEVLQAKGFGLDLVLHGVGSRGTSEAEALSLQSESDFDLGWPDFGSGAVMISSPVVDAGSIHGVPYSVAHAPSALREYIKGQLNADAGGKYMTLRLAGSWDLGCADSCGTECLGLRYGLSSPSLAIDFFPPS